MTEEPTTEEPKTVPASAPLRRLSGAWRLGTWRLSNSRAPAAR